MISMCKILQETDFKEFSFNLKNDQTKY
jgi:hypothetical protein